MRGLSIGKGVAVGVLTAAIGLVGSYGGTAYAGLLEDQQQPASTIVTKAKELAKVQTERATTANEEEKDKNLDRGLIQMSDLLKGVSVEAKLEFLDSLTLVDGKVASVRIDFLKHDLNESGVQKILSALNPHPQPVYKVSAPMHTMALCGNDSCDDAACRPSGGHRACLDKPGYMCFGSCN